MNLFNVIFYLDVVKNFDIEEKIDARKDVHKEISQDTKDVGIFHSVEPILVLGIIDLFY